MKNINIKNYILTIFAVALLLVISEVVYNIHSGTPLLINTFLKISSVCQDKNQYACEASFLKKAASIRLKYYKALYPDLVDQTINIPSYTDVLEKNRIDSADFNESKLTLIYYDLGLSAYRNGDINSALTVWQTAINLNPDLSYTYVELANLYLKTGNVDAAKQVLNICGRFGYPREHCRNFLDSNVLTGNSQEPGFLETAIVKILAAN